ncbi:small GTP-binding protein [Tritrichomonas foetus]|uniref:Small GTP-binding protein n=1 Tax=Tritrichomonas foetus TaxID=1144522 RepID=A0A1J4JWK2_9EUKA|nr:small GTP-binding protein [Tritrichomonas foetus]|eukprot:OHT03529.1 small GTP-binding protein [Tritrichomonas foetus]
MIAPSSVFHGRVVLIGNTAVGKTSILNQVMDHTFNDIEPTTIGANYQLYTCDIDDIHVEIQIWDTAGQERFRSLGPIYFRNSIGAICVYDATNKESFNSLPDWISSFTSIAGTDTLIAIVGNKCDLSEEIQVTKEDADYFAQESGYLSFQTSAKTGDGIDNLFKTIAQELIATKTTNFEQPKLQQGGSSGCC